MKKTKLFILGILLQSSISHGQNWNTNGLNPGAARNRSAGIFFLPNSP